MSEKPTVSISLARKVNVGNYENAEVFVSISGLHEGASQDEIEALLTTGSLAYGCLRKELQKQIALIVDATDIGRMARK